MRYRSLGRTGVAVSIIGFGASPLGDVFHSTDRAEGKRAVHHAIDCGINLFDVSPYYGLTLAETRLGEALTGKRDKVFLATKCGRYDLDSFDFSAPRIRKSIDESLARLGTDYVDLLQAHDVEFGNERQIIQETIPALLEIQRQGKARFVGITGYPLRMMRSIAEQTAIDTVLSYCRYNLLVTDLDGLLTPLLRAKAIGLINASPLHMGLLTKTGAPAWHPAPEPVKHAAARIVEVCTEYGAAPSTVALRFCLDYPYAASTLVGMSNTKHVEENVRAMDADLDPALMREIAQIVEPVKDTLWASGRPENTDQEVAERVQS